MSSLYILACSAVKAAQPGCAAYLYRGQLHQAARRYIRAAHPEGVPYIYTLSAKHGLVNEWQRIRPYEHSLRELSAAERRAWAETTGQQIADKLNGHSEIRRIICFAGRLYRGAVEHAVEHASRQVPVEYPLAGLGIGQQLAKLKQLTK